MGLKKNVRRRRRSRTKAITEVSSRSGVFGVDAIPLPPSAYVGKGQ